MQKYKKMIKRKGKRGTHTRMYKRKERGIQGEKGGVNEILSLRGN
jgi:hypothetical protein